MVCKNKKNRREGGAQGININNDDKKELIN